ncbi:arylsulfatase B-like [Saccoglossus kowalevskii]|uniref:Arylsulfatase B-like n=1 Tax=Saccoglossus kowalevskii TaxID=10224 RepID=A0ABM0MEU4_SACKO|nr:PREDICTED: arylsulfatase B-like [Saccoglossus kowalevskii]
MDSERRCLPTTEITIAQELKLKQYTTHAVGKWHLGFYKEECLPNNRGFDSFFGIYSASADHYTYQVRETWWDLHRNAENVAHQYRGQYSSELYAKEARTIIKDHDVNKPMFLYLAFQAAHKPIQAPDKYIDMYPDIDDPARRVYAAMVTCMDDAIGSVVDQLKESQLWNNTVLIVSTGDTGTDTVTIMNRKKKIGPVTGRNMYKRRSDMVFMQNGAPAHTARVSQEWCSRKLPGFPRSEAWYAPPETDKETLVIDKEKHVRLYNIVDDETESNDLSNSMPDKVLECLEKLKEYFDSVSIPFPDRNQWSENELEKAVYNHELAPWGPANTDI